MKEDFDILLAEHQKNRGIYAELQEKKKEFQDEYDKIILEQKRITEELVLVNLKVQNHKEKLEDLLKNDEDENNEFGPELLLDECKSVVNKFVSELNKEKNMQFRIEYSKNLFVWKLEDENMTFWRLKQETKLQFGKNENEFYFADENGSIYLDELNVKKALFPLASTVVNGYVPKIKVVDNKVKVIKEKEQSNIALDRGKDNNNRKLSLKESIKLYLEEKWIALLYVFFFAFFLGFYIDSCIEFRNSRVYKTLIQPFQTMKSGFESTVNINLNLTI